MTSLKPLKAFTCPSSSRQEHEHLSRTVRPSASEWYPRLYLGWDYEHYVDVYCYFFKDSSDRFPKISWAIHPVGPPFHGCKERIDFDHILKLSNMQCDEAMSKSLKEAIVGSVFTKYVSQDRFKYDTPVFEFAIPPPEEILSAWEKGELDPDNKEDLAKAKSAVKEKFNFEIEDNKVEFLTRISKLGTPIFASNVWRSYLCFNSKPLNKSQEQTEKSLKRKYDDETGSTPPSKKLLRNGEPETEISISPSLEMNILISKWLRLEADIDDEDNQKMVQEWLKNTYDLEASLQDIQRITDDAKNSTSPKSPLETPTFRGLVAIARNDLTSNLMNPFRVQSESLSSQILFPAVKIEE